MKNVSLSALNVYLTLVAHLVSVDIISTTALVSQVAYQVQAAIASPLVQPTSSLELSPSLTLSLDHVYKFVQ